MSKYATSTSEMMARIKTGMGLVKCRKCGCMADALSAAQSFADGIGAREMLKEIWGYKRQMEQSAYECLGCKRCWGAEASNFAHEAGGDIDSPCCEDTRVNQGQDWPVASGDYVLGNIDASVAVCTLGDTNLPTMIASMASNAVAIVGRCETENIGIEKVVLNIVSNPRIRRLILCGTDTEGHLPGDALLKLKESGVDANMRIVETASRRPVLRNLSLVEVERFREQVEIVDRIGCADSNEIGMLAVELSSRTSSQLPEWGLQVRQVPHVRAKPPERLMLDKAGFFIIIPDHVKDIIACEHYSCDGTLTTVIEGKTADLIASTAIEKGLVSRLDHAAYLGRELTRAEISMKLGIEYVQDQALGKLRMEPKKGMVETNEITISGSCGCSSCR